MESYFDVEATVWIKVYAEDKDDVENKVLYYRNWEDWDVMNITKVERRQPDTTKGALDQ